MCQAVCKDVKGAEWKNLYYKFVERNKEVHLRSSEWKEQGQDAVEEKRSQGEMRRVQRPDQRAEEE